MLIVPRGPKSKPHTFVNDFQKFFTGTFCAKICNNVVNKYIRIPNRTKKCQSIMSFALANIYQYLSITVAFNLGPASSCIFVP